MTDTTAVPKRLSVTRTNLHEKRSDNASAATTTTTSTTSNSIQFLSKRDSRKEKNTVLTGSSILLHKKNSREKSASNPEELPEVWTGTSTTVAATDAAIQKVEDTSGYDIEEISKVNPAPEYTDGSFENLFDSSTSEPQGNTLIEKVNSPPDQDQAQDNSNKSPCYLPPITGSTQKLTSFGSSHSSKNSGIVIRYSYELVQDLTGVDWTINSKGDRDGSEYLVESILPEVEQEILGGVVVPTLFEECGVKRYRRGLRRKLLESGVIGVDTKPDDFPLPQTGAFGRIYISLCLDVLCSNSLFLLNSFLAFHDI